MKKKLLVGILTVVMTTGICAGCGGKETGSEVTAGENQRLAYAIVTSIEGNDMSYMEVDESRLNLSGSNSGSDETSTESGSSNRQQRPQMDGSNMPEMSSEMMDMENFTPPSRNGEMPDMENFTPPDGMEMPDMNNDSSGSDSTETQQNQKNNGMRGGMMGGASATVQIPVGVPVYTTANTKTTFSRLQSGDVLKILFETDTDGNEVVIGIWMVQ